MSALTRCGHKSSSIQAGMVGAAQGLSGKFKPVPDRPS